MAVTYLMLLYLADIAWKHADIIYKTLCFIETLDPR